MDLCTCLHQCTCTSVCVCVSMCLCLCVRQKNQCATFLEKMTGISCPPLRPADAFFQTPRIKSEWRIEANEAELQEKKNRWHIWYFSAESSACTCWTADHTCSFALLLSVKAVFVAIAASVPELGTSIRLLVIVPADVIFPTSALVQRQVTSWVCRRRLWGEGGEDGRRWKER